MILNPDNEIDKKLSEIYTEETIHNATKDTMEYLGMNISEAPDDDIQLKIYYENNPSYKLYKESQSKDSLIEFLYEKNMISFLETVYDKNNSQFNRYNVKIKNRYKNNMLELFEFLEKNIKFFSKYKDEILKLSQIKYSENPDDEFASLFFFGIEKDESEIKKLKLYWIKHPEYEKQYLETLKSCGIDKLEKLIPLINSTIENCGGNIFMTGIDYNEKSHQKHKIYLEYPANLYNGLLATFSDNEGLIKKINLIQNWHKIHQEFYCDIVGIGKDAKDNITLNFYFMLKKD